MQYLPEFLDFKTINGLGREAFVHNGSLHFPFPLLAGGGGGGGGRSLARPYFTSLFVGIVLGVFLGSVFFWGSGAAKKTPRFSASMPRVLKFTQPSGFFA